MKTTTHTDETSLPSAIIKPYTPGDLASLYQVSPHTIKRWLRAHDLYIGKRVGRYYSILQVTTIFERLGVPPLPEL